MNYLQKVKSERDELKAELERVKAERDAYQAGVKSLSKSHKASQDQANQFAEEIDSLKSRLPVNRDGDVVLCEDSQLSTGTVYGEEIVVVEGFRKSKEGYWILSVYGKRSRMRYPTKASLCHSSAESCRAAHETEKGA